MTPLVWTAAVIGSLLAGAAFAGILALPKSREPLAMLGGAVGIAITVSATGALSASAGRVSVAVAAGLIGLGGFVGGYGLVSALLGSHHQPCATPELPPGDARNRILALIVADLEPQEYHPGTVTRQIEEFVDAGLPEPSIGMLPFFYAGHKARYRAAGGTSPEPSQASALTGRVSALLDRKRFAGPVLVECSDGSSLARAARAAAEAGYRTMVVATPYVAEPFQVDREKRGVDTARLDPGHPRIAYTPPLSGSDRIAQRLADRAAVLADDTGVTGVALVIQGQPGERAQTYAAFEEQESAFANRVRMMLVEHGIEEQRIRLCWNAWRDPDVSETVRHLAALGSTRILVVPVTYPFESLETLLELPVAIRQARTPEEVHVVQLPPWRDDPVVAEEIARVIETAACEFESEDAAITGGGAAST